MRTMKGGAEPPFIVGRSAIDARKGQSRHLKRCSTFHGRAPVTGRKPPGLFFSGGIRGR